MNSSNSANPSLLQMQRQVATSPGAPAATLTGLRWLMATAAVVPLLMFIALGWHGYVRTVEQARHALLQTSRVIQEHAAKVLDTGEASTRTDEVPKLDAAAFRREYLTQFYRDVVQTNGGLTIALVRGDGGIIAGYPPAQDGSLTYDENGQLMRAIREGARNGIVDSGSTLKEGYRLAAYRQLQPLPIYVVVSRTSRSVLEEWRHDMSTLAVFVVPTWIALMLAVGLAVRRARNEQHALLHWHDETLRRTRAEGQLRQFQKYEALAELTGGIAHDFNNLLNIISTNATIMSLRPNSAALQSQLDAIGRAVANGSALTQQLLAFARRQPLTFVRTNIRETLPAICDLARHSLPRTIELRCEVTDTHDVMADAVELQLAIINMTINARDAMPDGGVITVRAFNVPAGSAEVGEVPDTTRDYVAVSISDTGTGIPLHALDRIFEPFFTTKKEKGTGLGLSRVYGYGRQLGGSVTARNLREGGAMLMLYIPAIEFPAEDPEKLEIRISGLTSTSGSQRS